MPFTARDVDLDLSAYQELIARGFRTVPVTLIGDDPNPIVVIGFKEDALKSALQTL